MDEDVCVCRWWWRLWWWVSRRVGGTEGRKNISLARVESESKSRSVVSDSLRCHGLYTVHGILQARILESVVFPFSRGSSQPRDRPQVSCTAGRFFITYLILCRPLLLLPPIPPSIRVFSNESTLHMRWPKYWSFSFSISPSNEHSGLMSFGID